MRIALIVALASATSLLGCGGGDSEGTAGSSSGSSSTGSSASTSGAAGQNQPPSWDAAPKMPLELGQGKTLSIPIAPVDPEGDMVTVALDTSALAAGVEAADPTGGTAILTHADYAAMGTAHFGVNLDDGHGGKASATVDLDVRPIRWLGSTSWKDGEGPEAREHGAFIVDAEHGRAFLVYGSGYKPYLNPLKDVWRFDFASSTWTEITPTGDLPTPGGSHRVAQIPGQQVAYLYGGYGANGTANHDLFRATYTGDGVVFKKITQTSPQPQARDLHMFVYDAKNDRFFAFGGVGSAPLNDTWMMKLQGDAATWTKLTMATSPTPRYGFFYGVDQDDGRALVWSGAQGTATINPAGDAWALDMRSEPPAWHLLLDAKAPGAPPGRRNGAAIFDPTGPRLFVYGGTADAMTTEPGFFALDARPGKEAWAEVDRTSAPPLRSSCFGFYDAVKDQRVLGFGNTASGVFRDLWTLGY